MGRLTQAREALARAATNVGKLRADEERLLKELKTFEDKPPQGMMLAVATRFAQQLSAVQKELQSANAVHDRAITDMSNILKDKGVMTKEFPGK